MATLNRSIGRGDCADYNEDDLVTTGSAAVAAANVGDSTLGSRNSKGTKVRKRTRVRWKEFCAKKVSAVTIQ